MSVMCGRCGDAVECGAHPERFLECQDNAARFDILKGQAIQRGESADVGYNPALLTALQRHVEHGEGEHELRVYGYGSYLEVECLTCGICVFSVDRQAPPERNCLTCAGDQAECDECGGEGNPTKWRGRVA